MKKFLVLLISCILVVMCLTACGVKEEASKDDKEDKVELTLDKEEAPAPTEAPTPEPTEVPTPEPTEAPTPEPTEAPVAEHTYKVELVEVGSEKVMAIKLYRDFTGTGLAEAKDAIDNAPCVVMETTDEEAAKTCIEAFEGIGGIVKYYVDGEEIVEEEPTEEPEINEGEEVFEQLKFSIYLEDVGSEKVKVIKVIRDELGYGLKEAKDLVDAAPVIIYIADDLVSASDVCDKLAEVGSTATVETFENPVVGENPKDESGDDVDGEGDVDSEVEESTVEMNEDAYYMVLEDVGSEKVKVIKVLRDTLGIGLEEAKNLADNAPIEIGMTEDWNYANSICAELDEIGATAYIYDYKQLMELKGNKEPEEATDTSDASGIIMEYSVEDVFYITSRGCAITGTVDKGTVRSGDEIIVILEDGTEIPAVVNELESFRVIYEEASEGANVAIYIKDGDRKLLETAVKIIIRAE